MQQKALLESVKILSDQIRNLSKSQRTQLQSSHAISSARSSVFRGATYVLLLLAFGSFSVTATTGLGVLNSLWFWFATLSTVGFGDYFPDFSALQTKGANGIFQQAWQNQSFTFYLIFLLLGVVAVAYLLSSAIEFVSLSSTTSQEEMANDHLKKWREQLRLLHGRKYISSDNQSIDLVFQMIDHEDDLPSFTINRKEITVCVCLFAHVAHLLM